MEVDRQRVREHAATLVADAEHFAHLRVAAIRSDQIFGVLLAMLVRVDIAHGDLHARSVLLHADDFGALDHRRAGFTRTRARRIGSRLG